ncbi:ester cyclase [Roseicella frigidaeris]|uniref:Ester cyclase n=1 Tax=Roseicella frigidaeris TaxID=2230885 RepID=A0A327M6T7_9PROT|nr:ester cyclase [Roseicella frigidaeris]RAI58660.1 ester cyclase [Roseicella frigidaeris]
MSLDDNKQLARDYFRAFLARDLAWFETHVEPGFRRHDPGLPFEVIGPQGVERLADALLPAIPDMRLDIEDIVAEGEKVLVRLTIRGTHRGELLGIMPTGKSLEVAVLDLFHIRKGRLAEHWALLDNLGMLRQLGVTSI